MTEGQDRVRGLAVLVFGAAVIGLSPILVRLSDTGPAAAGVWRLVFALPFLAIMTVRSEGALGRPSRLGLAAGLMFALDLIFWHYSITYTSVTNATVLANLTPVVVTAFAWIFLRQRPQALFLVAVALAVAGAWTMALARNGGGAGLDPPMGNLFAATTSVWYALYMLAISAGRAREGASRLMFWSSLSATPLVLAVALVLGERVVPQSAAGWAACIGLGLMHAVGQGAIAWAMGRVPTPTASVVMLIQPMVAAVLGWLLFAEAISPLQGLGAAIALSGVVLAQWVSRPRSASPAT